MENIEDDIGIDGIGHEHIRSLPHDHEAERSVLAAILRDNGKLDDVASVLGQDDFYTNGHKLIYATITRLRDQGKPADLVTIGGLLSDMGKLSACGGKEYLVDLDSYADIATNFEEYVQMVRDKAALRSLMSETEKIRRNAHEQGDMMCEKILDDAEQRVFGVSENYHLRRGESIREIRTEIKEVCDEINERYEIFDKGGLPHTGLLTGYSHLDQLTLGLQPSDLIILAARPSVGKTSLMLDIVRNVCKRTDTGEPDGQRKSACVLFSLEMSSAMITRRLIGMEAPINQHKLRSGEIGSKDWGNFGAAQHEIERWRLWIDEAPLLTISEMRSRVRRLKRTIENTGVELGLIAVDYLQLMEADRTGSNVNRVEEVTQISRGLKSIAREVKLPVLALSQLSRRMTQRGENSKPQLSDLRDSGAIEQDADLIMFLAESSDGDNDERDRFDLIIGKHRNGPTGVVKLRFEKEHTHFEPLDHSEPIDDAPPHSAYQDDDPEGYIHS